MSKDVVAFCMQISIKNDQVKNSQTNIQNSCARHGEGQKIVQDAHLKRHRKIFDVLT